MSRAYLGVVIAALFAAAPLALGDAGAPSPPGDPDELAILDPGVRAAQKTIEQALPPPPVKAVLKTSYFGTITVDHVAHLGRHIHCVQCHDPGPVRKIAFTPKIAHERCKGCHQQEKRGPTDCRGCHVMPPPPSEVAATPADGGAPGTGAVAKAAPAKAAPATAMASATPDPEVMALIDRPLRRVLEVGAVAGAGYGPALRVSAREGNIILTHSFERLSGGPRDRTMGLIGAGLICPVRDRLDVQATMVGGFDAIERPVLAFLPALGGRVGVEWEVRRKFLDTVQLSVTGLVDLSGKRVYGEQIAGTTFFASIGTGVSLQGK